MKQQYFLKMKKKTTANGSKIEAKNTNKRNGNKMVVSMLTNTTSDY